MKRLLHSFSLSVALSLLVACSGLMETKPSVYVDRDLILRDAESMKVAMNGVYASLYNRIDFITLNAHQCFGVMAQTLTAELMGEDMVQMAEGAGWFWKDYCYEVRSLYTNNFWRPFFTWNYYYTIICNVNYIIAASETASGSKEDIDFICAQARGVRAYCYFMLVQFYQQTLVGHEDLPGVPIYLMPTTSSTVPQPRSSVKDVYWYIDVDIKEALDLFDSCGKARDHVSCMDKYAVNMLKARVSLVENRWDDALEAAQSALELPGCRVLSKEEATVIKGTFDDQTREWTTGRTPFNSIDSPCVIWGAEMITEESQVYASFYSHMDACSNVYYAPESQKCISNWLYAQIGDSDVRKGWWNGNVGVDASNWRYGANVNYNQFKFQWADQKSYKGDYIFMRAEEAWLIKAEALCRLKRYAEARQALNEVVLKRDPVLASKIETMVGDTQTFASVGNVTTLLDEILLQRRIELWGEAGRIHDILRLGKGWTRSWTVKGEPSNHTNLLNKYPEYLSFPSDYLECILMIPQCEIDSNPNIGAEDQNPYVQQ